MSKLKSFQLENFGNESGKKLLEEHKPACFTRPTEKDPK